MHYYKATIQYDGTGYSGFQWQKDCQTIQNDINQAVTQAVEGQISTTAASRTDSGVHARMQLVRITSEAPIDCISLLESFKKTLPSQIRCLALEECPREFHPIRLTQSKEYRYLFTNKRNVSEKDSRFVANIFNPLDINLMKSCAQKLQGRHDFCNFYSLGSNVKTTIREVTLCELTEINPHTLFNEDEIFKFPQDLEACFQFKIEADGFLKQMIRHIVRGLWMVGSGRMTQEDFLHLLEIPKVEKQLWRVAPSNGLFLYQINYSQSIGA
ncbi:MAG: tRNA pseudouridine(38-40) synthase TruA [Bacteriovoracaceae bacterium]|nr:tRNA pseudouridine(38-40) synthase TruA [Bacteriovoracaceae bacterium]